MGKAIVLDEKILKYKKYRIKYHDGWRWQSDYNLFDERAKCIQYAENHYLVFDVLECSDILIAYSKGDDTKDVRYHKEIK